MVSKSFYITRKQQASHTSAVFMAILIFNQSGKQHHQLEISLGNFTDVLKHGPNKIFKP